MDFLYLHPGCGADTPEGTLSKDQVSDEAEVKKTQTINNQVTCQAIDDAEDDMMHGQGVDPEADTAATSFDLSKGKGYEWVDNSVWRVGNPESVLAKVSEGIDTCIKEYPGRFTRIDSVKGFPDAIGYTYKGNGLLRRILVPLGVHVVVVGAQREGRDEFTVEPAALLKDAVAAGEKVDE